MKRRVHHRIVVSNCRICAREFQTTLRQGHTPTICSDACLSVHMRQRPKAIASETRFWTRVLKEDGCWPWNGSRDSRGYGWFWYDGKNGKAHRFSFEIHNPGVTLTDTDFICHACDNPRCVRPDHLFLGDAKLNSLDRSIKGRCPKGETHPRARFSTEEVLAIRARHASGESMTGIARALGVSYNAINCICSRITWKHVA